jgi:F1F0 ATPase subunit 2
MTMHELMSWLLAALAGVGLGVLFFGGLWWTVRKGVASRQPALWFLGSLLLRMGVVVAGFLRVGADDWRRVLLCLLGFVLARLAITWLTRSAAPVDPRAEVSDAP